MKMKDFTTHTIKKILTITNDMPHRLFAAGVQVGGTNPALKKRRFTIARSSEI